MARELDQAVDDFNNIVQDAEWKVTSLLLNKSYSKIKHPLLIKRTIAESRLFQRI